MSRPTPSPWIRLSLVGLLIGALACGGDASGPDDPEPEPVTVTVQLTMTGEDLDPDGYTLVLGSTSREVGAAGSTGFTGVVPGTYDLIVSGLSPNCSVDGGATRQVTVTGATQVTLTVTCVSVIASGLFTEVACPSLAVPAAGAILATPVAIGSLPPVLEEPLVGRVTWEGGEEYALTVVERASDGSATMVLPFHPGGSLDGGQVSVRIGGGRFACPAVPVTLPALPAAPGEVAGIAATLQGLIDLQLAGLGLSEAVLKAVNPADIPPLVLPLFLMQAFVDHPGNPSSLAAILAGNAPETQGVDLSVLERILAGTGLREFLEAALAAANPSGAGAVAPIEAIDALECVRGAVTTAQRLDECMELGVTAQFRLEGMTGEVLKHAAWTATAGGTVPHAGVKVAAAIAGATVFLYQKLQEGTASLLPTAFVDIIPDVQPALFLEDEEATGEWTAHVTATSDGWTLDAVALNTLAKAASLTGAYEAWVNRFADPNLVQTLKRLALSVTALAAIHAVGGSETVTVAPETFGPIDISELAWSERTLNPETALKMTGHTTYQPWLAGTGELRIRTRSGRFGGRQIATEPPLTLEVEEIKIQLEHDGEAKPVVIATDTKRGFDFTIRITGSKHPEQIVLDPSIPLKGSAYIQPGNPAMLHYEAPEDLSTLPDILVVRHTATTGARANSTEPRVAMVEIRQAGIVITPSEVCLAPGATQQFDAAVVGLENNGVTWSASQGSITPGGLYTAPGGLPVGTEVTVTATSSQDNAVSGTATVTVGCLCSFSVTVGGTTYTSQPGDKAHYMPDFTNNGGLITVTLESVSTGRQVLFAMGGTPVTPGTYNVSDVGGTLAYTGLFGYSRFSGDVVTLFLQEYVQHTSLIGAVSGTVRDGFEGVNGPPLALTAVFGIYPDEVGFLTRSCTVP